MPLWIRVSLLYYRMQHAPCSVQFKLQGTAAWAKNRIKLSNKEKYEMRNAFAVAIGLILARVAIFAQAPVDSPAPPDTEIRKILADRVGSENLGIGIVVGVIDAKGRRVVAYGS